MKIWLLIIYYFGGSLAIFVGVYMIGGLWPMVVAIGLWAFVSALADRALDS